MKTKKPLVLTILSIILVTSIFMYRKYRKAKYLEEQKIIRAEQAEELLKFQRQQDSIERKRIYDSVQNEKLKAFNKKFDAVKEKRNELNETMKKLQEEMDAKSGNQK